MKAIRIAEHGPPSVMRLETVADPVPGRSEILVRHTLIGVNFIDTYHRTGLYPTALPTGLGLEAAGVVERIGEDVEGFAPGDRVAYCNGPLGAYAELSVTPAGRLVKLPDAIPDEVAAAAMLKGLTAQYLSRRTFSLAPGHTAVVHAAAGGVGQILTQWGASLGATIIAVVSSNEKAEIARRLGAAHVLLLDPATLARDVRSLTGGEGADVVYDSVGKDTLLASLDSLKPLGMLVSFGNASGPPPPIDPLVLSQKGSLFLTRPTLFHYTRTPQELQTAADDLFDVITAGKVVIADPIRYPLADAARAHADLEGRRTTGSLVLVP